MKAPRDIWCRRATLPLLGEIRVRVAQVGGGLVVCALDFGSTASAAPDTGGQEPPKARELLGRTVEYLHAWLSGEAAWDPQAVPLHTLVGTDFQRRVWQAMCEIPEGGTCTYGDISQRVLGHRRGARAVGQAVGSNPLAPIWPCHRVLATQGLGGYGGGLPIKKKLLQLEAG